MRVFIVSRGYTRRSTVKAAIAPAFLSCQLYSLSILYFSWPFFRCFQSYSLALSCLLDLPVDRYMCVCARVHGGAQCASKQVRERVSRKKVNTHNQDI